MKVLLVDDDPDDTELFHDAIKTCFPGVDCRIVHDADAARAMLLQFTPHIVFLDMVMYPINGKSLLREFTQLRHLRHTRFVIISGLLMQSAQSELLEMGATFVIEKPANYETLCDSVNAILAEDLINVRVKLLTNDGVVHNQTDAIQALLSRVVDFDIALNTRVPRPNMQFSVSKMELAKIKSELGYNLLCFDGLHWQPNI